MTAPVRMKPIHEEAWAKDMPMGTSRMRDWLVDRYARLDEQGKPLKADWMLPEGAKQISDLIRVEDGLL